ncbi:MAG: hypothetical protein C4527_02585 [Candidatus Omnitrophota bacterium]|nr:MAG: hypothetical protein C4527_02585 [Candidatus Omnitrophota bacterium]
MKKIGFVLQFFILLFFGSINAQDGWALSPERISVLLQSVDNSIEGIEIKATLKLTTVNQERLKEDVILSEEGKAIEVPQHRRSAAKTLKNFEQQRIIEMTFAGGMTQVIHQMEENESHKEYSFMEFHGLNEDATSDTNPNTGRKTHLITGKSRMVAFTTPVCHTFGRGLSHFSDLPMQMEAPKDDNSLYTLTIEKSDVPFFGTFILDHNKGFCWVEGEYYNGPPGYENKVVVTASDFRKIDGVWIPYVVKVTFHVPINGEYVITTISDYQIQEVSFCEDVAEKAKALDYLTNFQTGDEIIRGDEE